MSTSAPWLRSSRTTSTTLELRMSGQFSLKVMPSTSARAPLTWMRLLAMSRMICPVTYSAMLSFRRRPARIISAW